MFIIDGSKKFKFQSDAEDFVLDKLLHSKRESAESCFDNYIDQENNQVIKIKGINDISGLTVRPSKVLYKLDSEKYSELFEEWVAMTIDNLFEVAHKNNEGAKLTNNRGTDFITVVVEE